MAIQPQNGQYAFLQALDQDCIGLCKNPNVDIDNTYTTFKKYLAAVQQHLQNLQDLTQYQFANDYPQVFGLNANSQSSQNLIMRNLGDRVTNLLILYKCDLKILWQKMFDPNLLYAVKEALLKMKMICLASKKQTEGKSPGVDAFLQAINYKTSTEKANVTIVACDGFLHDLQTISEDQNIVIKKFKGKTLLKFVASFNDQGFNLNRTMNLLRESAILTSSQLSLLNEPFHLIAFANGIVTLSKIEKKRHGKHFEVGVYDINGDRLI